MPAAVKLAAKPAKARHTAAPMASVSCVGSYGGVADHGSKRRGEGDVTERRVVAKGSDGQRIKNSITAGAEARTARQVTPSKASGSKPKMPAAAAVKPAAKPPGAQRGEGAAVINRSGGEGGERCIDRRGRGSQGGGDRGRAVTVGSGKGSSGKGGGGGQRAGGERERQHEAGKLEGRKGRQHLPGAAGPGDSGASNAEASSKATVTKQKQKRKNAAAAAAAIAPTAAAAAPPTLLPPQAPARAPAASRAAAKAAAAAA